MTTRLSRALAALLAAVVAVLTVGVGTASAHVRVSSADAAPGGFGELTFRVPNESDTASTTTLRVQIPAATPLASVRTKPVPGWSATLVTSPISPPIDVHGSLFSEAVTEVVWNADAGAGIAPGQYQTFSISGGPFPEADAITFPTLQGYDDGSESAWIEPAVAGAAEPEHPAPVLTLAGTGAAPAHGGTADIATVQTAGSGTPAAAADPGTSGTTVTALALGLTGLVTGVAGLGVGLSARRRGATA